VSPWLAFALGVGTAFLLSGVATALLFWTALRPNRKPRFRTMEEIEAERDARFSEAVHEQGPSAIAQLLREVGGR
jgi:hypothetical protein